MTKKMKPQLVRPLADRDIEILYSWTSKAEDHIGKQVFLYDLPPVVGQVMILSHALGHLCQLLNDLEKDYVPMWFKKRETKIMSINY